ncbi:MAG: hypothetical protein A3A04_00425 [Candidatus Harrisonbacteria bacterium RIFCSPLOWO2_01_FULL_40_28]|uniref:Cell shape-determining protein MreC n=2 Tax=Candidatus Harrisoniibacteriota TaxID=1817905 RepID=A0A1G1ZVB2_9BACT|nr:MAG: hypothetical protein A3A04_00425 [Candidatus Harrisonbacteria bacterium RIFCSPLOWO2_01_FULL_40_28]OGY68504.1 MAG: hypothetical protein A2586_02120 [Candidatus Harrisonbacteria bacterium RIFOXYD1_FULL_40_9]
MRKKKILVVAIVSFVVFTILYSYTGFKKYVVRIFDSIREIPQFLIGPFYGYNALQEAYDALRGENEALRAKVFRYEQLEESRGVSLYKRFVYKEAEVYSRYPFISNNYLAIDKGESDVVPLHAPVVFHESLIIGTIQKIFENSSRVRTIFDPGWQFAVRVGTSASKDAQALFVGGNEPKIVYIEKSLEVRPGDGVYTATTEFPMGLKIGDIEEVKDSEDRAFHEATLKIPYNINTLSRVFVITNFGTTRE